ncbi:MAG: cytochrome P450 [Egibacteraceae bacterium]
MTLTNEADVALFDFYDPTFHPDSPEVRAAAEANWYARTRIGLAVLRYEDCTALLGDRRLRHGFMDFLAGQGITSGPFIDWMRLMLLTLEGETHSRLRRLVSKAFTQRSIERLRPFMRAKTRELIDGFADRGECEFMEEFADPYPAWVSGELIGIPETDFDRFVGWATDMGLGFGPAASRHLDRIEAALAGLYHCCDELIAERRQSPGDDLVSGLIAVEEQGDRLTEDELRALVVTLVFSGQGATRNQLGLAMTTFAEHPDQWVLLGERPELALTAVEELMRVNPAVPIVGRVALEDFTYRDLDIPAGTHLSLFLRTTHNEPATFGDASFDITAERPAQLGFGGGIHYCLGAALARFEMREALPILAACLCDLQLTGPPAVGMVEPETLPIRFAAVPEPAARSQGRSAHPA